MTETDEPNESGAATEPTESGLPAEPTGPSAPVGWLPHPAEEIFGEGASAEEAYGLLTVDVPAAQWVPALEAARDRLGCSYFDWLSAVDEPGTGFRVCAHVAALPDAEQTGVHRLVLRTTVPHEAPELPTATGVYAGASWHERETHEMFGIGFAGHPHLVPLLLPDSFEGHPLRKDFVLAARVAKAWPGAKEPGESGHGGPKRRQMLPPGVPDPNDWGPLKGQLPPVPARPARGRGRGEAASGERPARRTRTASAGSTSQRTESEAPQQEAPQQEAPQQEAPPAQPKPKRPQPESGADQATVQPETKPDASKPDTSKPEASETKGPAPGPRSSDAPWHHARPAFEEPVSEPEKPAQPAQADQPADPGRPAESDRTDRPGNAVEGSAGNASEEAPGNSPGNASDNAEAPDTERRDDA